MYILLIISFLSVIFSNMATRVGADPTLIYQNFPDNFKMLNKKLLKIYIVYPKSLVTKSSFALYISQIILFFIILILNIVNWTIGFSNDIIRIIWIVYGSLVIFCYLISFAFDRIAGLIFDKKIRDKNNNQT